MNKSFKENELTPRHTRGKPKPSKERLNTSKERSNIVTESGSASLYVRCAVVTTCDVRIRVCAEEREEEMRWEQ